MTALLVPLAFWDFLNAIMTPLYGAVSAILVGAHAVWGPVLGANSGITWVMSIVSLTVVIRTLLIPLFVKQINSARNMQLVQPKLKALQDKYGADREKLGQETMKLYQEEGVNPAASCLPLLLQMPIFIALFNVLNGVARAKDVTNLSGANVGYFFEKNPDLVTSLQSSHIFGANLAGTFFPVSPFGATQILALVLMLGMTGVLFMTQLQLMSKNMPPEALTGPFAQQQKMMLYLFPVMYLVGGVSIPIGVLVYWLTSNLWTLGQQYLLIHNNPTPNTPAYIEWEERMIRKGKDPKMIQAQRMAKRQKRPVTPVPVAAAASDGDSTDGTPKSGKPTVQRQQVQRQQLARQQPRATPRSTRKKTPGTQGQADTSAEA